MRKGVQILRSGHFFYFGHRKDEGKLMKLLDIYEKSDMFRCAKGGGLAMEKGSLFVSGIILREVFFPQISFKSSREEYSFEQVWFTLCLYHDKRMESESRWKRACMERTDRENGQWESKSCGPDGKGHPMQLSFSPLFQYSGDGIKFTNGVQVTGAVFSEAEITDYYYFRSTCFRNGGMDHGIAGGLFLYEDLIQRHRQRYGDSDQNARNLYSYAANTMMAHNICIGSGTAKGITPEKDPMLFLLILAETLEPLQYAEKCEDYRQVLKQVEMEIEKGGITLIINPDYFAVDRLEENLRNMQKKIKVDYKIWRETAEICITM